MNGPDPGRRRPPVREWTVRWVASLVPQPLAAAPERVLINFSCALMGLSSLLGARPGTILGWPAGAAITWSLLMIFGGSSALLGYWNYPARPWSRPIERLGYLFLLFAAAAFGVAVIVGFGWRGVVVGIIFLGIACSKLIRLLVTSAYRSYLLHSADDRDLP